MADQGGCDSYFLDVEIKERTPMLPVENRTITYIEDDPEMIDLVGMILGRRGFQINGASGGRKGLDQIIAEPPDLILLDLMMPDMD